MTEARHTPGPWFVHDIAPEDTEWTSRFEVWAGERDEDTEGEHGIPCAGLITSHVKGEANAHLIKAAPEMREALKAAEEWLEGWASAESYLSIIRAALKSADGETE